MRIVKPFEQEPGVVNTNEPNPEELSVAKPLEPEEREICKPTEEVENPIK